MVVKEHNFEYFIDMAKQESDSGHINEFGKYAWDSISTFTKNYYKNNFDVPVNTDEEFKKLYKATSAGLDGSDAADIMDVWVDVYWYHSTCNGEIGFIPKEERDDVINRLKNAVNCIKNANQENIRITLVEMGIIENKHNKCDKGTMTDSETQVCGRRPRKRTLRSTTTTIRQVHTDISNHINQTENCSHTKRRRKS